ncbi:MAG: M50 family metallopeptidase [Myxococcales bacterium]
MIDLKRIGAVLAALTVGVLAWDYPVVLPLKLLVVFLHESGHALATKLVGGSVDSIRVSFDEGGLCMSRYEPTFLNKLLVYSGGYLGSALSGAVLLILALRWKRSGRGVLFVLAAWLVVANVLWGRDVTTLAIGAGLAVLLGAGARFLPADLAQTAAVFLATFNGMYALFDVRDDLWDASRRAGTDAALLAATTPIPSLVWAVLWTLFAAALLGGALWMGVRGEKPKARGVAQLVP